MAKPFRLIFAGAGEFGAPTLMALANAGYEIVQVITQPDRPAGRGRVLTPTPIASVAETIGYTVVKTGDINALSLPVADLMVVIAFGQKISEAATHHARLGSVNLHASRLPRHRGAAPINAAILSGDTVTGNSVIRLAPKMDAGAVLGQSSVVIGEMETAGELHDRLSLDGVLLMLRVIDELRNGSAVEVEQDQALATLARKLSRETARIDWNHSADAVARQIRGLWPWPGCRVAVMDGETSLDTLGLVRAATADGSPGQVAGQLNAQLNVATSDGRSVRIVEVQPAGKRPMLIDAYARGKRWTPGLRLVAVC